MAGNNNKNTVDCILGGVITRERETDKSLSLLLNFFISWLGHLRKWIRVCLLCCHIKTL